MGRQLTIGNPPIKIDVRVSQRSRRLSLRVSRLDGRVSLSMPPHATEAEAIAFLNDRESWVRKHLSGVVAPRKPQIGGTVPYLGEEMLIVAADTRRVIHRNGVLSLPRDKSQVSARVQAFLKLRARDALAAASEEYCHTLGVSYERMSLRDTRSRWGSCSSKGVLMYSWRLIMAPPGVLRYVAAHEVSHLVEMNHSPAFWTLVRELMPGYEKERHWLRENGSRLHQVKFVD